MKKRILSLLMVLVLLCVLVPQIVSLASAADPITGNCGKNGDNLKWSLNTDTGVLTITGTGDMANYGANNAPWLNYLSIIDSVVLEDGVASIGGNAFNNCGSLRSVTIPNSVQSIGTGAFQGCYMLSELNIDMTEIGNWFKDNMSITKLVIGDHVERIGDEAFSGCTSLSNLTLGKNLLTIGSFAFQNCQFKSLTIPDKVTTVGNSAFAGNYSLESIKIGKAVSKIGTNAFAGCMNAKDLEVAAANIGNNWFQNMTIATLKLDEGVVTIGDYAFSGCTGLNTLTFPDSLTDIGDYSFLNCSGLFRINFGAGIEAIGKKAFDGCLMLTRVDIKDLAKWCAVSFQGSNPLTVANNLYMEDKLVTNLVIPDTVTAIKAEAFSGCTSITSLIIPDSVTEIGKEAFYSCARLLSVRVGNGVSKIGDSAFAGCSSMNSLTLGTALTEIGDTAFGGCASLKQVSLPNGLTTVGNSAFIGCAGLKSVEIPATLTTVGKYAFSGCTSLLRVDISDLSAWCKIDFGTEENSDEDTRANPLFYAGNLYLNGNKVTEIKASDLDDTVTEIKPYTFKGATCLKSLALPAKVEKIGKYAFCDCTSLEKLTFAAGGSLTEIGDYAFFNNGELTELALQSGTASVGKYAFSACSKLAKVTLPESLTKMGEGMFSNCPKIEELKVPAGVTRLEDSTFYGCAGLRIVSLPKNLQSIGNSVFAGCSSLAHVCYGDDSVSWQLLNIGTNNTELTRKETLIHWNTNDFSAHVAKSQVTNTAATCTQPSSVSYRCACNYVWAEETGPANGHVDNNYDGKCDVCGKKIPGYVEVKFVDVPNNAWYRGAVQWAVENKITSGTDKTHFSPNKKCTRAEIVQFLWKAAGSPKPKTTTSPFTDVKAKDWYYNAVLWAYENNITAGISPTRFGVSKYCTRAEAVTFFWSAQGCPEPKSTTNPFTGDVTSDDWFYKAALWGNENGIIYGTGSNQFSPAMTCTRAMIVSFLWRAYK